MATGIQYPRESVKDVRGCTVEEYNGDPVEAASVCLHRIDVSGCDTSGATMFNTCHVLGTDNARSIEIR